MKRRLEFLLKILLGVILLFFLLLLIERVRGQVALARYKRELIAKGETLDVRKLLAPPVAAAENGATEITRLKALLQKGKVLPDNYPPKMKRISPGKAMVGFRQSYWIEEKATNSWEQVALDLATNRPTLDELRVALAKPGFDFQLDHSRGFEMSLLHLSPAKSLSQWFGVAAQNSLRNGENQMALENLLAALSVPRVLENDRIVISELVRIAISSINLGTTWEALQANVWTDRQWALIQAAWENTAFHTNMIRSLRIECADGDTYFERFKKSNDETYKYMFPIWLQTLTATDDPDVPNRWQEFFRKQIYCRIWRFAWLAQDEKFYLAGMQQMICDHSSSSEKAARPGGGVLVRTRQSFSTKLLHDLRFGMSAKSLGSLSLVTVKSDRAETDRSMVLCAIALKRYSLRHGKPAPDLNSLVPEVLTVVPTDYMDGKPMKYHLNSDGTWRLYSVGDDGRDDGGDPSPAKPDKPYRAIWHGKDAVWPSPATPEEILPRRAELARERLGFLFAERISGL